MMDASSTILTHKWEAQSSVPRGNPGGKYHKGKNKARCSVGSEPCTANMNDHHVEIRAKRGPTRYSQIIMVNYGRAKYFRVREINTTPRDRDQHGQLVG